MATSDLLICGHSSFSAKTGRPPGHACSPPALPSRVEPPLVPDPRPTMSEFSLSLLTGISHQRLKLVRPSHFNNQNPSTSVLPTFPFLSLLVSKSQGSHHLELHFVVSLKLPLPRDTPPGFGGGHPCFVPGPFLPLLPAPGLSEAPGPVTTPSALARSSGSGHPVSGLSLKQSPRTHPPQHGGLPANHHSPTPSSDSHRNGRGDPAGPTEQLRVLPAPTGGAWMC